MNRTRLATISHLRPYLQLCFSVFLLQHGADCAYRSLRLPEMSAPTDLSMRVTVIPHDTSDGFSLKSVAISVTVAISMDTMEGNINGKQLTAQRDSEEIKGIPGPAQPPDKEKIPLVFVQTPDHCPWIDELRSRRLQRCHSARDVTGDLAGAVKPAQLHVVSHLCDKFLGFCLKDEGI